MSPHPNLFNPWYMFFPLYNPYQMGWQLWWAMWGLHAIKSPEGGEEKTGF